LARWAEKGAMMDQAIVKKSRVRFEPGEGKKNNQKLWHPLP